MLPLSRRHFLATGLAATVSTRLLAQPSNDKPDTIRLPAKAVTKGPNHHFFGYYDKCPWDATGRYLLAMESAFCDRQPKSGEELTLGMVDLQDGNQYIPFDKTAAWCWQQGTMLQWLGSDPKRHVIYNSVVEGKYVSTIRDVHSGKTHTMPLPIYAVANSGLHAVTLDFARLHRLRPGYGYASVPEQFADDPAPDQLGIWGMDLVSGRTQLIVTLKQLAAYKPDDRFPGAHHWVNHLQFNPSGTRTIFLHRWKKPTDRSWQTRLFTVKPNGADLRLHLDDGMTSHFDWLDDTTILAWARTKKTGDRFYLIDVNGAEPKVLGESVLTKDGHCSYSPNRKWILNDTYPDKDRLQWLMLFNPKTGRRFDLNQFHSPKEFTGPTRCDLHPRWNRDGTQVCFDGCHEPQRQLYVVDVSDIVKG